jgi:hypothetical protein
MSDTDQLSAELRELRDRSAEVPVSAPPRLEAITATGRRLRRRRWFALGGASVVGATAATALALGLVNAAGPAPSTMRTADPTTIRAAAPAKIRTAAFTIYGNRDGTVTLIIDPAELFEANALQKDLAKFGIPALVTTDKICTSDPEPAGLAQVETYDPGSPSDPATITIDPSAIPAGSELSFGTIGLKDDVRASYSSLIDPNAYTCTTNPPTDADPHPVRGGFIKLDPAH